MPHFFINSENIFDKNIVIDDKENYHHLTRSRRVKLGEKLLLIDENGIQYETVIEEIDSKKICVKINESYPSTRDLDFNLYLAQSPLRSDSQNILIEKATELGARGVYPISTQNCAVSSDIIEKKIEKWQKIMYEASKQCERKTVPTCFDVSTLEALINDKKFDKIIVMAERHSDSTLKEYLKNNTIKQKENVLVIIGPEGGFSEKEFEMFKNYKLPLLTLGDLILKAETAVIITLGNIVYEYR